MASLKGTKIIALQSPTSLPRIVEPSSRNAFEKQVARVSRELIEPLCESTEKLFKSLKFHPDDRMRLSLDKDGKWFEATIFSVSSGEKRYPSASAAVKWPLRIPERKTRGEEYGKWQFAGTDFTAILINAHWPQECLIFEDDARILYDYLLSRFMAQARGATLRALYKTTRKLPELSPLRDNAEFPLADFQTIGLHGCYQQEGSALFMEQGTGKTPIVIARICNEALASDEMIRILVVAPSSVRANWRAEAMKFATVPGKVTVLRGTQVVRVKQLIEAVQPEDDCRWSMVIGSYDGIVKSWGTIRLIPWHLCVLDESHFIKSHTSKRWKVCSNLRDKSKQRMVLTGTPVTNTINDLWTQLEFLGEGLSGFSTYQAFHKYYHRYTELNGKEGPITVLELRNLPLIRERLARVSYIAYKKEVLPELPDKVYDIHEVKMSKEQAGIYAKVAKQLAVEIEAAMDAAEGSAKSLVVTNALTKLLRLAQITSGFITWDAVYSDFGDVIRPPLIDRFDPDHKLDALVDILKAKGPLDKTIVWSCWRQNIKSIRARLAVEGLKAVTLYGATSYKDREEAIRSFNCDPECKIFVGNPSCGGMGINLHGYDLSKSPDDPDNQTNCTQEIYYSQNWSMTDRAQSEDRAHRRGTRENVRITDLVVPGTIDEEIRCRVTQKIQNALVVADVRDILQRLAGSTELNGD